MPPFFRTGLLPILSLVVLTTRAFATSSVPLNRQEGFSFQTQALSTRAWFSGPVSTVFAAQGIQSFCKSLRQFGRASKETFRFFDSESRFRAVAGVPSEFWPHKQDLHSPLLFSANRRDPIKAFFRKTLPRFSSFAEWEDHKFKTLAPAHETSRTSITVGAEQLDFSFIERRGAHSLTFKVPYLRVGRRLLLDEEINPPPSSILSDITVIPTGIKQQSYPRWHATMLALMEHVDLVNDATVVEGCGAGLLMRLAIDLGSPLVIRIERDQDRLAQAERYLKSSGFKSQRALLSDVLEKGLDLTISRNWILEGDLGPWYALTPREKQKMIGGYSALAVLANLGEFYQVGDDALEKVQQESLLAWPGSLKVILGGFLEHGDWRRDANKKLAPFVSKGFAVETAHYRSDKTHYALRAQREPRSFSDHRLGFAA